MLYFCALLFSVALRLSVALCCILSMALHGVFTAWFSVALRGVFVAWHCVAFYC